MDQNKQAHRIENSESFQPLLPNAKLAIGWLSFLAFFSVLNESVFNIALPDIASYFGIQAASANWVNTAFMLSFSIGTAVYGKISDSFGSKKLLAIGLLIYCGGSLFGFLAYRYFPAMIAARFIQGIGASAVPALIMVIITRYIHSDHRGKAFGMIGSLVALGESIGPVLGGLVTEYVHWSFLYTIPMMTILVLPFLYKKMPSDAPVTKNKIDRLGIALLAMGTAGFSLWMTHFHWSFLVLGILILVGFVSHINRTKQPFIEPALLRKRTFMASMLSGGILLGSAAGFLAMVPYMMKDVHQLAAGAIGSGIIFPGTVGVILFGMMGGVLVDRWGNRFTLSAGLCMMVLSFLILSIWLDQSPWLTTAMLITTLGGLSFIKTVVSNTAAASLEPEQAGAGMGILNFVCFLFEGFGMALVGGMLSQPWLASPLWNKLQESSAYLYSHILGILILFILIGGTIYLINYRRSR
ncbi:tetracycline efflux MFS transporter Tet(L) [Paenibacillus vulneris]